MKHLTIDQIIDANMTVTDHLLRDAIHAVVVDVIYQAAAEEREACAKLCDYLWEYKASEAYECATAIRKRGDHE